VADDHTPPAGDDGDRTRWADRVDEAGSDDAETNGHEDDVGVAGREAPPADLPGGPERPDAARAGPETDAEALVVEEEPDLPPPGESVLDDVVAHFADIEGSFAPAPAASALRTDFFDLSYREGVRELERYWVDEPYAFVAVLHDEATDDTRYHVVEPTLSEYARYVREEMLGDLRDLLLHVDVEADRDRGALLDEQLRSLADRYAREADPIALHKVRYYIRRDLLGYGKADPLVRDSRLEDISCDGPNVPVFVYHRDYRDLATNVVFEPEPLKEFVIRMAQRAGKHVSVASPMADASLPNGSRAQLTLGEEVSTRGSNFTIRQFADVPITPVDLVDWGTFSVETMTYFWMAIENNLSLVFAGGTASGKTTSMNAVSMFIPRKSKVITIEDTREISLPHDNWIQSVTREGFLGRDTEGDVNMYQLLQAALRQRPEYLIVGEIRTEAEVALAFFQAMATGHTAYTTMHADSVQTVLSRLQNPPLGVPEQMVRELDIVAVQQQVFQGDRRVRRNTAISELGHAEEGGTEVRDVYRWQPAADRMKSVGASGKLHDVMHMRGWEPSELQAELGRRERLLTAMVEQGVSEYDPFTTVVRRYGQNPEEVLELAEAGELARLT
jgi:flagellar protein FlaI